MINDSIEQHKGERILGQITSANGNLYAYDTFSNQIVSISNIEGTILQGLLAGETPHCIEVMLGELYSGLDAKEAMVDFLQASRCLGVFQPVQARRVASPPTLEEISHQLDYHVMSACLEVTQDCSMRCKYCYYTAASIGASHGHNDRSMSLPTAKSAIDFLMQHSEHNARSPGISFYGGEPLLEIGLISSAIEYANRSYPRRECTFHMTTNGLALNRPRVRALLASAGVSILVSLDGPKRLHDALRVDPGGNGTHDRVSKGLESLLREYPEYYANKVSFNAVVASGKYYGEVVDFFNSWPLSLAAKENPVRYSGLDTLGLGDGGQELVSLEPAPRHEEDRYRAQEEVFVQNRIRAVHPNDGLDGYAGHPMVAMAQRNLCRVPKEFKPSGYCVPGSRKLFISADGDLGMCEKVSRRSRIGSLKDGFDKKAIHQELVAFHSLWSEDCSQCVAQRFCGSCPAVVIGEEGEMDVQKFSTGCRAQKEDFPTTLDQFVRICTANPEYLDMLKNVAVS